MRDETPCGGETELWDISVDQQLLQRSCRNVVFVLQGYGKAQIDNLLHIQNYWISVKFVRLGFRTVFESYHVTMSGAASGM